MLIVVLCGGEPTNITQQLWSFLFLFPRLPPGILLLLAEVPGLNWDVALRLGRFLPFESRSFTTIHTLFTSKLVVMNSGLLL